MKLSRATALTAFTAILVTQVPVASAASPDITLELRPHCTVETTFGGAVPDVNGTMTPTTCPEFTVRDPQNRETPVLHVGDVLDLDLVIHNPSRFPLDRFRTWIAYDSTVLQGSGIILTDIFPAPTPGEADFSPSDNFIKVSGATTTPVSAQLVTVARITLKVISAPPTGDILTFDDPSGKLDSRTAAVTSENDIEQNLASPIQGGLIVRMEAGAATSTASSATSVAPASSAASSVGTVTASSVSSVASLASNSSSSKAPAVTLFNKLQVQGLRITTDGSSVYLAWNPLPSTELVGYNVYYGTVSGRYLQRRSVDKNTMTLTIRALPLGVTEYAAVRGVNAAGQETDFSQEVAVTVGNPKTSTSPLTGALIDGGPQGNTPGTDGNVAGETGPASWLVLFALISAVIGTFLAVRRQFTATIHPQA